MEKWNGKVAVVTGASAGIGAAICELLVENGVKVIGFARRIERVEEQAKKLQNKKGELHGLKVDITNPEQIVDAFKVIEEKYGPVHILVNNAGIICNTKLSDGDYEIWKKVFDTNVLGLCTATREAVRSMKKHNVDGHIIHINSMAGHRVYPSSSAYPASKFAVTALTESLRLELLEVGSKIKVTSISPGLVETEIFDVANMKIPEIESMPSLKSEDIADNVIFVLSAPPHVHIREMIVAPTGQMF